MPELLTMRSLPRRLARGFTLIELMIVVAIVAILAAVALPSYRDYVMRGYVVNATTLLSAAQAQMERYYQDNRQYTSLSTTVYAPCDETKASLASRTQGSAPGAFVLTCNAALAANSYTMTATGVAGSPVAGFVYTVDNLNNRTTTIASTPGWNTTGAALCWIVKKGQTC